ncbi:MAG: class I SAM-dependent rRNA methyltransferase [Pirellulales bacterium]|nr:class I SAM-dependent rRNA methyltransferase [Pirellulales bacterium]
MTDSADHISAPSGLGTAQVILKPRKAQPFFGRHPWVLDSAIHRVEGAPADGDVVDLLSDKGRFIARGMLNGRSKLRVRLYTWDAAELINDEFFYRRLESAIKFRQCSTFSPRERSGVRNEPLTRGVARGQPNDALRLVFSEADGLSGLIVDRYGEYLVVQATSLAIWKRLDPLVDSLLQLTHARGIVLRQEAGAVKLEGFPHEEGRHWGKLPDGPVFIEEHGLRYGVDLREGQKTGFYLDQRENRRTAAAYFAGRRVLDMFCYSGGFAMNAIKHGGAAEVLGVDTSEKAVALARANAELNGLANLQFQTGDGFRTLQDLAENRDRFGAIVLDPPKFARSRAAVNDALMAYHHINRLAVNLLEPGGILVTCSCSGHVAREDFLHMLAGVAQRSGRNIQILEQRGAAEDHPVAATCLESEYLKCFICRVI